MGLFDWLELGLAVHGEEPEFFKEWFKGSFDVTLGEQIAGVIGGCNKYVLGQDVSVVCDPLDMFLSAGEQAWPITSGLVALSKGIGGRVDLTYGSTFHAHYVGPTVTVRRGHSDTKTSENTLIHKKSEDNPDEETDEIDVLTSVAAGALSLLINAVSTALELALHFAYPKFGGGGDAALPAGYGKTPKILKICSYTITNRLIALLRMLEEKGSFADFAKQFVEYGKFILIAVGCVAAFCLLPITLTAFVVVARTAAQLGESYAGMTLGDRFA
jgi:hypothetical protein